MRARRVGRAPGRRGHRPASGATSDPKGVKRNTTLHRLRAVYGVTLRQMAREAGVSVATMRRVLVKARVSKETRHLDAA